MKKIDLHLHTQYCKKGDGKNRIIDTDGFINKMNQNSIGICSITNHNIFDIEEYDTINNSDKTFLIFPGIELDVELPSGAKKHIIVVCNPNVAIYFSEVFNEEERDYDEYHIKYDEFIKKIKLFKEDQIIVIPHFLDKDKRRALNEEEKNQLLDDLTGYIIILETSKLQTMGIVNAHQEASLIGSDVKDWNAYDQNSCELAEIKFNIDSFEKFIELAKHPIVFIKNVLEGCNSNRIKVDYDKYIDIYEDINVIFGAKGSGKTRLLDDYIYPQLEETGKSIAIHKGSEGSNNLDDIVDNIRKKTNIDKFVRDRIINNLSYIFNYKEEIIENFFSKYINYHKDVNRNTNANKIKKTLATYSIGEVEVIDELLENCCNNIESIEKVEELNNKREEENQKAVLEEALKLLKKEIIENIISEIKYNYTKEKTDRILKGLKDCIKKKTGKISKPNNISFNTLVAKRKKYLDKNSQLVNDLESIKKSKKIKIGEIPDKGEIFVKTSVIVLDKGVTHHKGIPFEKNKIKENRETMEKIFNFDIKRFHNINTLFANIREFSKTPEAYFEECVKIDAEIVRNEDKKYNPSDGEKSILSISAILENDNYDYYLFDEIEQGLGNAYVSSYIIPKLKKLRDKGKTVVLTTHNANIAINTLPLQTIYCNYKGNDNNEIYYEGNMYSNELCSITDRNNIVEW